MLVVAQSQATRVRDPAIVQRQDAGAPFELAAMPVWSGDDAYRILQREPAGIIRDLKGACMKAAIAEDAAVHGVTECRELFMAGVEPVASTNDSRVVGKSISIGSAEDGKPLRRHSGVIA